jgi:GNAT superfamily N-acetyltransferase
MSTHTERALAEQFLRRDPLRTIVPLKMLGAYGADVTCHYSSLDGEEGALLLLPTAIFSWDRIHYPANDVVVLLVADSAAVANTLLDMLPAGSRPVFKLAGQVERDAVMLRFPVRRTTAFVSYTTPSSTGAVELLNHGTAEPPNNNAAEPLNYQLPATSYQPLPIGDINISTHLDPRLSATMIEQGHDLQELGRAGAAGEALFCLLEEAGEPAAFCFAEQIYTGIWEIGGVYTAPEHRRKGYARRVVLAALAQLQARSLRPRYQVREDNLASGRLAEAIGLVPFVVVEHFLPI